MRACVLVALLALACACSLVSAAAPKAAAPLPGAASPVVDGLMSAPPSAPVTANRPVAITAIPKLVVPKPPEPQYRPATDFMGRFGSVPMNPREHLLRNLKEDSQYVASVLRAPMDLGDVTACKHSDIERDERDLKRIAVRINHRRVSLRQQQHWIDAATDSLRKIEAEIASATDTARNLAEQMDTLTAQKEDITAHVRRAELIKELNVTSASLMRLKDSRMKLEISAQKQHNERAARNAKHNDMLAKMHRMRTKQGLALGSLVDPKPYRFAQQGMEAAQEEQGEAEAEQEQEQEQEGEAEAEVETEEESQ